LRLAGKAAVVTGGGQGIGRAIARMYAREGASVAIAARSEARLSHVKAEIEEEGGRAIAVRTDVRREPDVEQLVAETTEAFGSVDILVNNAGVGALIPIEETDSASYDRVVDTNLRGMVLTCRFVAPLMKERGRGSIINIASVHGLQGRGLYTVYSATKGGIIGGTRALAAELAPDGIRVNSISPGAIWLETMLERALEKVRPEHRDEFVCLHGEAFKDDHRYFQPLEVVGETDDIAYCAVYLGSEESRFVTGQNIVVDGGLTSAMTPHATEEAREKVAKSTERVRAWVEAHRNS